MPVPLLFMPRPNISAVCSDGSARSSRATSQPDAKATTQKPTAMASIAPKNSGAKSASAPGRVAEALA